MNLNPQSAATLRLPFQFLLVNVPALVFVTWLGSCLWLADNPEVPRDEAIALTWPVAALVFAGFLLAFVGNWLLYRRVVTTTRSLVLALSTCSDQQEHLQAILETAADAIFTWDETGRLRSVNPAAERVFGYESREQLLDRPIDEILADNGVSSAVNTLQTQEQRVLGLSQDGIIVGVRKDGSRFPVSVAISKLRQAGQALFVAVIHDLSELHKAHAAAEAASRAKTRFLVHMSHEFRTPLNGILGVVELLQQQQQQKPSPEETDRAALVRTLAGTANQLSRMVEQVLDFAQLETGQLTLGQQSFSLRELIGRILGSFQARASAQGVKLTSQISEELRDHYRADPVRLQQILGNLLSNAIEFTRRAGGEVSLTVNPAGAPRTQGSYSSLQAILRFEVRDNGAGIPADRLQRIFHPFEQADDSSTRRHGGIGLGLTIASQLIKLMGGRIRVDSTEGQGTVFRFDLPLTQDASARLADNAFEVQPTALLLLGDGGADRKFFEQHLGSLGWRAVVASSGPIGWQLYLEAVVQGTPFTAVLLDTRLTDVSAMHVGDWLEQLLQHRQGEGCPVVFLSPHDDREQVAQQLLAQHQMESGVV